MVVARCIKKVGHTKREEDEEHDVDLVSLELKKELRLCKRWESEGLTNGKGIALGVDRRKCGL